MTALEDEAHADDLRRRGIAIPEQPSDLEDPDAIRAAMQEVRNSRYNRCQCLNPNWACAPPCRRSGVWESYWCVRDTMAGALGSAVWITEREVGFICT